MLTKSNLNRRIHITSECPGEIAYPFELQPILLLEREQVYGYEVLFRGARPERWSDIDSAVLSHFSTGARNLPRLFINLSNESLLDTSSAIFLAAAAQNDLVFELSETITDANLLPAITDKVNELAASGLLFAIDDFGSGFDGLKRLYSFNSIAAVKIDGGLLMTAMRRPDAAQAMCSLIQHWQSGAIMTIAECIEDQEVMDFAKGMGVQLVQGWHIDALVAPRVLKTA